VVDVRDVGKAHVLAAFTENASGRHITVSESMTYMDISRALKAHFGGRYPFPRMQAPKALLWAIAPLVKIDRQFVSKNFGYPLKFDTSYIKQDLGMTFIPGATTAVDHFQQLLDDGKIKKRG
jgi:nucleoside-diphosphate-sugar epimerase